KRWTAGVAESPMNGRAYDNLASALLRETPPRVASADSVLRRSMAVDPGFVPSWVRAASVALATNRVADADTLLQRALRIHPGDLRATEQLARVYLRENEPEKAIPLLEQVAATAPAADAFT